MTGNPTALPARVLAAIVAIAALAVYSTMSSYDVSTKFNALRPDRWGAGLALKRFAPAARRLPSNADIGYISDLPDNSAAFLTAQYALAPRLLVKPEPARVAWAVGNFVRPADYAAYGARAGFKMVEDLGQGVILYQRAKP